MARINVIPLIVLAVLCVLALLGANGTSIHGVDDESICAYQVPNLDIPAADVVFVGGSRLGRGIDPVYMMDRIASKSSQEVHIERLVLNTPNIPQFRPLLARYIEQRGAPKYVVLQLLYNFKPGRQRTWDVPVNNLRNLTFASLRELRDIRASSELNEYDTTFPRKFEANYLSFPAIVMQRIEINIFAALRWPAKQLTDKNICSGDALFLQGKDRVYNSIGDDIIFEDTPARQERRVRDYKTASDFLPLSPGEPFRRFETDQLKDIIAILEAAGSSVKLMIMPALGDTELTQAEKNEIEMVFPGYPLLHPYDLFSTDVGPNLAKSFADTHHATPYGALLYSRHFADAILGFNF